MGKKLPVWFVALALVCSMGLSAVAGFKAGVGGGGIVQPGDFTCLCGAHYNQFDGGIQRGTPSTELISVGVTAVNFVGDEIHVTWDNGTTDEHISITAMREYVATLFLTRDFVERLWIAYFLAHSPDATDSSSVLGKTFTMELGALQPFQVTD